MKILLIHYRYFISGGPERYMFNVKKSLEEKGHKVIPFSIKNSQNVASEYENYFVENICNSDEVFVNNYPKNLKTYLDLIGREFYSFKVSRCLKKLIIKTKPDVCYLLVYKRALSPSVVSICHKYKIPIINRISDYNPVCGNGSLYRDGSFCDLCLKNEWNCLKHKCVKNNFTYSLMRYLSIKFHKLLKIDSKINYYICTNKFMAEMMEKYGYNKNKLVVLPTFFKETKKSKLLRSENNVKNKVKFLFIGNIDESKGIYDLLKAICLLDKEKYDFELNIVGGLHQEEINKVKNIIDENNLNNKVKIIPFIKSDDVYNYYVDSNVCILPTRWVENLPNTLIESLYFNRPVVVPNFGSFKYTVDDSVAFKFKPLSCESLKECIENIILNSDVIKQKSINCQHWFAKNFSEEYHIKQLIDIFSKLKK